MTERLKPHVLVNLAGRARLDLDDATIHHGKPIASSRVPSRMLLALVTELQERRAADGALDSSVSTEGDTL